VKDRKRRMERLCFYDHTGIEAHLQKMAQKGWLLEKIGNFTWIYRRIPPQDLRFCVTYDPKASQFDPEPSEEQRTFYDFCAHTGWMLAASSAQMQIFYNERENPVPIETDPVIEVETVHRSAKKEFLWSQFLLLAVSILNGALFLSRLLSDPIGVLSSTASLFTGICWSTVILLTSIEIGTYYLWRRRAKQAAERGEFLETVGTTKLQNVCLFLWLAGFLYYLCNLFVTGSALMRTVSVLMLLYVPTLIFLVQALKNFLKHKKAPAGVNRAVTLVSCFLLSFAMMGAITFGTLKAVQSGMFASNTETYFYDGHEFPLSSDELPLTIEDLAELEYDGYIRERNGEQSILLGQFTMRQHPRMDAENYLEMPFLEYTITVVKSPFLYNLCRTSLLRQYDANHHPLKALGVSQSRYEACDATPWGAVEAYRLIQEPSVPRNWYLLCYEDRIVEIRFSWEPTLEQMLRCGKALQENFGE